MIPTVRHTERGKTVDTVNKHDFKGLVEGREGMNRQGTEEYFLGQLRCYL